MAQIAQQSTGEIQIVGGGLEFYGINYTIGTEGTNAADRIDVVCQLTGPRGVNIAKKVWFLVYTTADTDGDLAATTVGGIALDGTGLGHGYLIRQVASTALIIASTDANGQMVVALTQTGGVATRRLVLAGPDGRAFQSTTITWA